MASRLLRENLRMAQESDYKLAVLYSLFGLGHVAASREQPACAARLWGAAEAVEEAFGIRLTPLAHTFFTDYEGQQTAAHAALHDDEAFAAAWSEEQAMTLEQAVDYALSDLHPAQSDRSATIEPEIEMQALAELRVFALGASQVERGEHVLTSSEWGHAKPKELLFYLLSHPEGRTKEQIGLALWPEASVAQLRSTFHVTLHRLRRTLGRVEHGIGVLL